MQQYLSIREQRLSIGAFANEQFIHFRQLEHVDTLIDFLISASEETRRHVDACIREALACAVKTENEEMVTW